MRLVPNAFAVELDALGWFDETTAEESAGGPGGPTIDPLGVDSAEAFGSAVVEKHVDNIDPTGISSAGAVGSATIEAPISSWVTVVDFASTTPPQDVATGLWDSDAVNGVNGTKVRFTWTPTNASGHVDYNDFQALAVAADQGGIWVASPSRQFGIYNASSGAPILETPSLTWLAGASVPVEIDFGQSPPEVTLSGLLTGNGVYPFTGTWTPGVTKIFTTANTLTSGRYTPDTFFDFNGQISDFEELQTSTADDIVPSGISSAQAIGTASVERAVSATGIASAEAHGTAHLARTVDPAGVASAEAFGTAGFDDGLLATGVASAETFGTAQIERAISATSVASTETIGSGVVGPSLGATGVASAEAHGTASLDRTIAATGIPSATVIGTALVLADSVAPPVLGSSAVYQLYGSGSNPARITYTPTAGSLLLMGRAGGVTNGDLAVAPTDSSGDTWSILEATHVYTDWASWGTQLRRTIASASTSRTIDCFVTAGDEHSVTLVEIGGERPYVQAQAWRQDGNTGAGSTHVSGSVTTTGPATLVAWWWGAGPAQNGDHIVTATGWTMLERYYVDTPSGYVQVYMFVRTVETAGTYNVTFNQTPTQGAQSHVVAVQSATIVPAGVPSAEAHGTAAISDTIQPAGVLSAEAHGVATIEHSIVGTGISTGEAHGTGSIADTIVATGIASAETIGTPQLDGSISALGVTSAEAFGLAEVDAPHDLTATGIPSGEAHGAASLWETIDPPGISSAETVGDATLTPTVSPSGLASAEAVGDASVDLVITGVGVASVEAHGLASLLESIDAIGVVTAEAHGSSSFDVTGAIAAVGVSSAELHGDAHLARYVDSAGVPSAELVPGGAVVADISPSGIASDEQHGSHRLEEVVGLVGVASAEAYGAAHVARFVDLASVPTSEEHGVSSFIAAEFIDAPSIESVEAHGSHELEVGEPPPVVVDPPGHPIQRATVVPLSISITAEMVTTIEIRAEVLYE